MFSEKLLILLFFLFLIVWSSKIEDPMLHQTARSSILDMRYLLRYYYHSFCVCKCFITWSTSGMFSLIWLSDFPNHCLIIGQHIVKGVVELIRNLLDLKFFSVDFVFNVINSVVQLGNVALSIFITSFCNLESLHKIKNFVF